MGLDKWLKPGETEKKSKKQKASPDQVKISKVEGEQTTSPKKSSSKLTKFTLVCPSVKCKYQKTIKLGDEEKAVCGNTDIKCEDRSTQIVQNKEYEKAYSVCLRVAK